MRFVKRPVEVDAWPIADILLAAAVDWSALPPEVAAAYEEGGWVLGAVGPDGSERGVIVPTLEGPMFGDSADWLIRGTRGEWYPCKPGPFADTFAPVTDDEVPFREAGDADPTSRCYLEACTLGPHPRGTEHRTWRASADEGPAAR